MSESETAELASNASALPNSPPEEIKGDAVDGLESPGGEDQNEPKNDVEAEVGEDQNEPKNEVEAEVGEDQNEPKNDVEAEVGEDQNEPKNDAGPERPSGEHTEVGEGKDDGQAHRLEECNDEPTNVVEVGSAVGGGEAEDIVEATNNEKHDVDEHSRVGSEVEILDMSEEVVVSQKSAEELEVPSVEKVISDTNEEVVVSQKSTEEVEVPSVKNVQDSGESTNQDLDSYEITTDSKILEHMDKVMREYRVELCDEEACQRINSGCMKAHFKNGLRRNPFTHVYDPNLCKKHSKNDPCPKGKDCEYAHSKPESLYHWWRYKTRVCRKDQGKECGDSFCPDYHILSDGKVDRRAVTFSERKEYWNKRNRNLTSSPVELNAEADPVLNDKTIPFVERIRNVSTISSLKKNKVNQIAPLGKEKSHDRPSRRESRPNRQRSDKEVNPPKVNSSSEEVIPSSGWDNLDQKSSQKSDKELNQGSAASSSSEVVSSGGWDHLLGDDYHPPGWVSVSNTKQSEPSSAPSETAVPEIDSNDDEEEEIVLYTSKGIIYFVKDDGSPILFVMSISGKHSASELQTAIIGFLRKNGFKGQMLFHIINESNRQIGSLYLSSGDFFSLLRNFQKDNLVKKWSELLLDV